MATKTVTKVTKITAKLICGLYLKKRDLEYVGDDFEECECGLHVVHEIFYKKFLRKVGFVGLYDVNGQLVIGWSRCAEGDQFSKSKAREIAQNRAIEKFESGNGGDYLSDAKYFNGELKEKYLGAVHELFFEYETGKVK